MNIREMNKSSGKPGEKKQLERHGYRWEDAVIHNSEGIS
jgi:hypothetical protein